MAGSARAQTVMGAPAARLRPRMANQDHGAASRTGGPPAAGPSCSPRARPQKRRVRGAGPAPEQALGQGLEQALEKMLERARENPRHGAARPPLGLTATAAPVRHGPPCHGAKGRKSLRANPLRAAPLPVGPRVTGRAPDRAQRPTKASQSPPATQPHPRAGAAHPAQKAREPPRGRCVGTRVLPSLVEHGSGGWDRSTPGPPFPATGSTAANCGDRV